MHPPPPSLLFLLRMRNGKLFFTQVRQIGLVPLDTLLLYRRIKYLTTLTRKFTVKGEKFSCWREKQMWTHCHGFESPQPDKYYLH